MVNRVSTFSFYQSTIQNSLNVQQNILTIDQQVSSGNKSQNFQGLGSDVQSYVTLEDQLSKASAYSDNNTLVSAQLNTSSQALGQIISIATNAKNLISQAENTSEASSLAFDQQMMGYFQQVAQQLNTQDSNGKYVFSGTQSDQPAVNASLYPTNAQLGVPDATYYQGNSGTITATIADGVTVTTNVTGNDSGFQDIMSAFATAKAGFDQGNTTLLNQAFGMMQQGVSRVTAVQTTLNATAAQISQANSVSTAQTTYWKTQQSNNVSADLVSLSTLLAQDQTVLQASFQAFAKINSLSLSQFLPNT